MATLYTQQSKNVQKTWLLMTTFFVVIIALGYIFSYVFNQPGILYFAVIFSIVMNFVSYWNSDKIALSLSGAKPASETEYPELHNIVENLAITAGLPKPKVYIINDPAPNAFATGRNKEHATVAVTTGIVQILDRTELEGVIAHELSHIGNRDILVSTVAVVLAGFVSILSNMFLRGLMFGGRNSDNENRGGGILAIVGIVLAILAPIFATLIQLAVSRKREYLADASGALLTRYPEGLARALEKISAYSRPMIHQNQATAHLFIANPFGGKAIANLFSTHPPIENRTKILREMGR